MSQGASVTALGNDLFVQQRRRGSLGETTLYQSCRKFVWSPRVNDNIMHVTFSGGDARGPCVPERLRSLRCRVQGRCGLQKRSSVHTEEVRRQSEW